MDKLREMAEEYARKKWGHPHDEYPSMNEKNSRIDYLAGLRAGLEMAAEKVGAWADNYPEDVFTPPEPYDKVDKETARIGTRYSAAMARHCSRVLAEDIRALMEGGADE